MIKRKIKKYFISKKSKLVGPVLNIVIFGVKVYSISSGNGSQLPNRDRFQKSKILGCMIIERN